MQRPVTKVRAGVESLEVRCVLSASGFHDAISLTLAEVTRRPRHVRSFRTSNLLFGRRRISSRYALSDGRAPAALAKEAHGQSEPQSSGDPIPLESERGMHMLEQSKAKRNFIKLISHYTTQINATYCSVASTAMVFNAGGVPRPGSTENPKGHYFDQVNLISEVKHKFDVDKVLKQGVTLDTYAAVSQFFPRASHGHARHRHHAGRVSHVRDCHAQEPG